MNHKLTIENNPYTGGITGVCSCSDPEWIDEGVWVGQVEFEGYSKQEVLDLHADHVTEVAE